MIVGMKILSYAIMYKSWSWEENQKSLIQIVNLLTKSNIRILFSHKENQEELALLRTLCDHCCIREEIKRSLRQIFKINII